MTLQFTNVFHTGYVVDDIAQAMDELAEALHIRWARLQQREMRLRTPDGRSAIDLKYTYSSGAQPPYVELLERVPGTLWETSTGPGRLHHLGIWSEDLAADSERLSSLGGELLVTFDTEAEGVTGFAYHRMPSGVLIELVDASTRPAMQRWLTERLSEV